MSDHNETLSHRGFTQVLRTFTLRTQPHIFSKILFPYLNFFDYSKWRCLCLQRTTSIRFRKWYAVTIASKLLCVKKKGILRCQNIIIEIQRRTANFHKSFFLIKLQVILEQFLRACLASKNYSILTTFYKNFSKTKFSQSLTRRIFGFQKDTEHALNYIRKIIYSVLFIIILLYNLLILNFNIKELFYIWCFFYS